MLKNKKHNTHEEWLSAYRHAQLERDVERSERLIEKAIARIPKGKSFFGWSGGKDAADEVYHNDKSVLYANRSVRKIDEYLKRKENGA